MKTVTGAVRVVCCCAMALGLVSIATPARAQWTQVAEIPATEIFTVWTSGDTVAAGADTAVYISTNSGVTWKRSAKPVPGVAAIEALWVRNGRLYAGTFGQGVFISDDLGSSWSAFNQGLVGGFLDSQLDVVDFQLLGHNLVVATAGAGCYVRDLAGAGTWQPFGNVFEPNQAANVNTLALGGTRLLASAGGNGMVFIRDPGDADWTISNLDNHGIHAGLQAQSAVFTGGAWVVGSNLGLFLSAAGQEPWTRVDPGFGPMNWTSFATQTGHLFMAFDVPTLAVIEESTDNGANWQNEEDFLNAFILKLAIGGNQLYAARADGLWRRPTGTLAAVADCTPQRLKFALAGPQPFRGETRLRFELPQAGSASIQLFDVQGRAAGGRIEGFWSAGPHQVTLDAHALSPGIYSAQLRAGGQHEVLRLVHVR